MAKRKTIKQNRFFVWLVQTFLCGYIAKAYNVEYVDENGTKNLAPPYILVSNHVSFWDPFWVGHHILYPTPQWVTSDNTFRNPLYNVVLKLVGSIPKTKFMSDVEAVGHILRVIKNKSIIGIFAEGRRTWDGRSLDILYPVSNLIKKLRLPVVGAIIKGGFLSKPRWAVNARRGKVTIEYELFFKPEELKNHTLDEVHRLLEEKLTHNEMEYQKEVMVPFKGKRPAEYIERFLFACPHCGALTGMHSDDDLLNCSACGYSVRYSEYGFLEKVKDKLYFKDPADWNTWQLERLNREVEEKRGRQSEEPILEEKNAILWIGYKAEPLKKLIEGDCYLYYNRLVFKNSLGGERVFDIDKIQGINVQDREKLEFYSTNSLYRCDFLNIRASSYKWLKAVQFLQAES